jgi:hypothetical protein
MTMLEITTYLERKDFAIYDGTNSQDFLDQAWQNAVVQLDSEVDGVLTLSWYDLNQDLITQVSLNTGDRIPLNVNNEVPYSVWRAADFPNFFIPVPTP